MEAGLKVDANDWDLKMDRELALACLGHHGPMMEALPAALIRAQIPAGKEDIFLPAELLYFLELIGIELHDHGVAHSHQ